MREITGTLSADGVRLGIVVARFNELVTKNLLAGALEMYQRLGGSSDDVTVVWVPGSYEIPLAAKALARREDIDAVVALGAVIRGATAHFDFVAGQAASGVMHAMLETEKPVIFGILTPDTIEQALERAGTKAGNKGAEAVMGAVEMVRVLEALR
ncbi:6,7-dimethyl-8-ribityllumazine synthase [Marinithermus hydrothermalis]|uniref:6,7-dimethyl-8-ribityllumazine synthase n=1 Tax=Marinithermus hydrothermalis (strain DSM 14884 / JCM 11576 / T1) TaxID=869210 RepID=F2NKC4_MARHT|nr:6,7-dimethyl-8-ribityllumazine synthase [Marinithermus hydrothermalis]AEB12373.1 6,7-dimethyl-8-ribityllumazine synthase [Marinithermus hydrothermalis DSM 14884]